MNFFNLTLALIFIISNDFYLGQLFTEFSIVIFADLSIFSTNSDEDLVNPMPLPSASGTAQHSEFFSQC